MSIPASVRSERLPELPWARPLACQSVGGDDEIGTGLGHATALSRTGAQLKNGVFILR